MYQFLDKTIPTAKCVFCGQSQFSVAVYYQPKRGTTYRPDGTPHFVEAICEDCLIENLLMDNAANGDSDSGDKHEHSKQRAEHAARSRQRRDEAAWGGYDNG